MRNFFNMDNGLFRVLGRMADLMILNILFIICCIPIVTIGPALTGMYYVTLKMAINEEGYIARGFLKSFRQNLRQGILLWLIMLLIGIVLFVDILVLRNATGTLYSAMRIFILATSLVYLMVMIYVFPTLARFENTIRGTLRNALLMAILDFPRTFLMLVITIGAVIITFLNGYTFWYGLLVWIMLGFSTVAFANSYFLARIFKKYMPAEEEESEGELFGEIPEDADVTGEVPEDTDMTGGTQEDTDMTGEIPKDTVAVGGVPEKSVEKTSD